MYRSNSQKSAQRPYSMNNPFRNASLDSCSNQYESDQDFQNWVAQNARTAPYMTSGGRTSSSLSFTDSIEEHPQENIKNHFHDNITAIPARTTSSRASYGSRDSSSISSPPPRPSSNNPFAEDSSTERTVRRQHSVGRGSTEAIAPKGRQSGRHLTSSEEKEMLRRKYLQLDGEDVGEGSVDLPPSYDEVARDKHSHNRIRAPREKQRSDRQHGHARPSKMNRPKKTSNGKTNNSSAEKKDKSKSSVLPKNVDTIDKLDVTGLFGGAFHHDGPFDACTPHRNKNTKVAPVLAFPADGPNSSITGVGGGKSAIKEVFGHNNDDDYDYLYESGKNKNLKNVMMTGSSSTINAIKPTNHVMQFDTKVRTELVHGPTTVGLGSTTFLDGAPAAKAEQREDTLRRETQGLQRKKSLSQRLKVGTRTDDGRLRKVDSDSLPSSPQIGTLTRENGEDEEDFYLSSPTEVRFDSKTKKESAGNRFLQRVKSLKVSRK